MTFKDIVSRADQYEVAKAKAEIAHFFRCPDYLVQTLIYIAREK